MTVVPERIIVDGILRHGEFSVGLDFLVEPGEVVGLWGDIGSGKSSVLALLTGTLRLAEGSIVQPNRPTSLLAQRYIDDLVEDRTGVENVLDHAGAGFDEAAVRRVLDELGVGAHVVDRLPWTFSGAEAQRIALAGRVCSQAPLILLDEPFTALDKRTGRLVRDVVASWAQQTPSTVVVAGTNAEHLEQVCERTIELSAS